MEHLYTSLPSPLSTVTCISFILTRMFTGLRCSSSKVKLENLKLVIFGVKKIERRLDGGVKVYSDFDLVNQR